MTLICRNWVAWLIMNPSPLDTLSCSATTRASQAAPRLCRSPTRVWGSAPGSTTWRTNSKPAQAEHLRELTEPAVNATDAGVDVEVQGDSSGKGDKQHLRELPDPEPDYEHRDQAEQRQCPQHLHRRIESVLPEAAEAGHDGEPNGRCRA